MDEEYEEEKCLVLVEVSGIIDSGFLHSCGTQCKLLGVETDSPALQLGHYVFKGEYEDISGTAVLFEDATAAADASGAAASSDASRSAAEDLMNKRKELKFYDTTRKKLNMTRAFLTPKQHSDSSACVDQFDVGESDT